MTDKSVPYRPDGIHDAFATDNGGDGPDNTGTKPGPDATPGADAPTARGTEPVLPSIGVRGWLRWVWRQVTSMRVALLLLMLLAVAAVPGSALPQRPQDPAAVADYLKDNPTFGPWVDRAGFLDVYGSAWFSAIYLLLFISLIGCILPRTKAHLQALRARPPRIPRTFSRFPAQGERTFDANQLSPQDAADIAAAHLRGRFAKLPTFRVDRGHDGAAHTISAERGYLRESGNLLFHLSLVGLLVAVGFGQGVHYRGQAIIVEERGFVNSVSGYDSFESGPFFSPETLKPFSIVLDRFESKFTIEQSPRAEDFTALVTVNKPGEATFPATIKVNHPLTVEGAKVYLQGNGYAPRISVTDADGQIAFAGAVPYVPEDPVYTSRGVIKVPDVTSGDQLGMVGYLLPTADFTAQGIRSIHPQPHDPVMVMTLWRGDLGLDDGVPQNVYELDTADMTQVLEPGTTAPLTLILRPGESVDLPDGLGTLTFEALPRFVALDLRHDPALGWILAFALSALAGLCLSLFTPRRRVWLRVTAQTADGASRTVVTAAGLARSDDAGLQGEVDAMLAAIDSSAASVASGDVGRPVPTHAVPNEEGKAN